MIRWEWWTSRNSKWIVTNEEAVEHMMEFRGGIDRPELREPRGALLDERTGFRIRRVDTSPRPPENEPREEPGAISDLFGGRG